VSDTRPVTECNIGWYDIISSVCYQITQREKNIKSNLEYCEKNNINPPALEACYMPVTFDQIKEKWGSLRIYYSGGDDYVDVFCDRGFFTVKETDKILNTAAKFGIRPKIHANELDYSGGIQIGVKHNALSVDHLEYTGDEEIKALLDSETMPTILPGAAFFLNMICAPARKMIDAGLPIAMASDFNPGSSPSGNMQFILSLACIEYKLTPEEAINATTINGAYAMELSNELGSIAIGKKANIFITKEIPSYAYMPYSYGNNKVETTIINGKII